MSASKLKWLTVLSILSALAVVGAAVRVFAFTPIEREMGLVQKVFYFHLATAWVGMLGFIVAGVAGVMYLVKRSRKSHRGMLWDVVGLAAVEVGMVFVLICILTGMIWAHRTWGTWWTWDPRLTTAAIMELAYAAYLMLRAGIDDPERRARFGAVYAIIATISVPMTFFSIRFFRTIHPVLIGGVDPLNSSSMGMTDEMTVTLMISLAAFTLLFATLLWQRIRLGQLNQSLEQARLKLAQ
jgi:heme exporter protein C